MKKTIDPMKELKSHKIALWIVLIGAAAACIFFLIDTFVLFSMRNAESVETAEWFVRTFTAAAFSLDLLVFCSRCEKERKVFTLKNMKLIEYLSFIMVAGLLLACIPHFLGNYFNVEREFISNPFIYFFITLVPEFIANIFKCGIKMQDDLDSIA